ARYNAGQLASSGASSSAGGFQWGPAGYDSAASEWSAGQNSWQDLPHQSDASGGKPGKGQGGPVQGKSFRGAPSQPAVYPWPYQNKGAPS
ncbi:unnamed protein product, partial [Durusdinium trenchii]